MGRPWRSCGRSPSRTWALPKVDHHRAIRTGFPEVVYAPGKTPDQLSRIAMKISETSSKLLITRAEGDAYEKVREALPEARYSEVANVIVVDRSSGEAAPVPGVLTVAAGNVPTCQWRRRLHLLQS